MKLITPLTITEENMTSTVPMEGAAYTWSNSIDYGSEPVIVTDGASNYWRNISTGSNLNKNPASNPTYWQTYAYPLWLSSTTYAAGDYIIYWVDPGLTQEYNAWRSKSGGNLNNLPPTDRTTTDTYWEYVDTVYQRWAPGVTSTAGWLRNYDGYLYEALATNTGTVAPPDDPTNWLLSGPTNRWEAFDNKTQSQTELAADIQYTIDVSGRIDTIGLLEMDNITSVNLTMMDGVTEVHNQDYSLISDDTITDYWEWFFGEVAYNRELGITGLPNTLDPTVIITLTGSGTRAVGHVTFGTGYVLGQTLHDGASIGIDDYSRIETDEFGNRVVVERGYSRRGQYNVMVEKAKVAAVYRLLAARRASPALFIPSEDYTATYVFGYPKNWAVAIQYPYHSMLNISIEGL